MQVANGSVNQISKRTMGVFTPFLVNIRVLCSKLAFLLKAFFLLALSHPRKCRV